MRIRLGWMLFLATALGAAPAPAESPAAGPKAPDPQPQSATAAPTEAAPGGLTVFVDPDTKKIRPPEPGELDRLVKSGARRPLAAPRALTNLKPGAGVGIALDSSYEMFMVVTKQPDGTLATSCVTGGAEAAAAVSAGAPAPPAKAKEAGDAR